MVKQIAIGFIFIMAIGMTHAQEIIPSGHFLTDSIKIGERVNYSLSVKYPKDWQIIFPDSTYDYAPFEFFSKTYFTTKTDSILAIDSVVYSLATFEIDPLLTFQLPVFIIRGNDSIPLISTTDSIWVHQMITQVPDSVVFKQNLSLQKVDTAFNYPYLIIGLIILLIIGVAVLLIFGKDINKKIKLYRLQKEFEKFSAKYENGINQVRANESNKKAIEDILIIWKTYMEKLENRPFTKYTSKEILQAGYNDGLKLVLQNIDRALYGDLNDAEMHKNFESLEDFTLSRYQLKTKEVING